MGQGCGSCGCFVVIVVIVGGEGCGSCGEEACGSCGCLVVVIVVGRGVVVVVVSL